MTFAADLAKFQHKTGKNMDQLVRNVTLEMANSVIEMSPVDTGRFRGNWQHGSGSPDLSTNEALDPNGAASKARIAASTANVKAGGIEYVTNNLPYAISLEYGRSTQAPSGMVRITVARFRQLIAKALQSIPK